MTERGSAPDGHPLSGLLALCTNPLPGTMTDHEPDIIRESWVANADAWTRAVRDRAIPSRRLGTDAAILAACEAALAGVPTPAVLDVGCGEGWLSRALGGRGARVVGIDASAPLIEAARATTVEAHALAPRYGILTFEELVAQPELLPGPYDLIVCNYSLFDADLVPLLSSLRARLGRQGRLVIQTLHPWSAGEAAYEDGWREETFAGFDHPFPAHMPWYFRTMASWVTTVRTAGFVVFGVREPAHPETGRPMSLLLTLGASATEG